MPTVGQMTIGQALLGIAGFGAALYALELLVTFAEKTLKMTKGTRRKRGNNG